MARLETLPPRLASAEYLDGETRADVRHEFVDGFVYARAGTTEAHNDIVLNLSAWLRSRLPPGCRLFNGSVKLATKPTGEASYYYPDVFVSCGRRDPKGYVRLDASLVIEVLSPSTERIDRGEKFQAYTSMPSVSDYMLVSQDGVSVEVFRRSTAWTREVYVMGDVIAFDFVPHRLPVADVYADLFD